MSRGLYLVAYVWDANEVDLLGELYNSMRRALYLAIATNMPFLHQDFNVIKEMNPSAWLGEDGLERAYTFAIECRNISYIKAYEWWISRDPFMANNVTFNPCGESLRRETVHRKRSRVGVGAIIDGVGTVTRFTMDKIIITGEPMVLKAPPAEPNTTIRKVLKLDVNAMREIFPSKKGVLNDTGTED